MIIKGREPARVRYNTIDGTGYAGIILGNPHNVVEYNIIRRAMSTLNDGGGVYTDTGESIIRHNIILETVGNIESSHPWDCKGHGIWPEFLSDNRDSVIENAAGDVEVRFPARAGCRIEAEARNGRIETVLPGVRVTDDGDFASGFVGVDRWLARHEGEEVVIILASLEDDRPLPSKTCRTCGTEYSGVACPRCRAARTRLRGR